MCNAGVVQVPSNAGGAVTRTAGYIEQNARLVAPWLAEGLGPDFVVKPAGWDSLDAAVAALAPSASVQRRAVIPVGAWTLLLTNGPLGTDVGVLPSLATRQWGCYGVRATCVEAAEHVFPGRVLEVYGPGGVPPLMALRSITAMNDGGRWVFETSGEPFAFERLGEYEHRLKRRRFTSALLYEYLRALGVPIDDEPAWTRAVVVEEDAVGGCTSTGR